MHSCSRIWWTSPGTKSNTWGRPRGIWQTCSQQLMQGEQQRRETWGGGAFSVRPGRIPFAKLLTCTWFWIDLGFAFLSISTTILRKKKGQLSSSHGSETSHENMQAVHLGPNVSGSSPLSFRPITFIFHLSCGPLKRRNMQNYFYKHLLTRYWLDPDLLSCSTVGGSDINGEIPAHPALHACRRPAELRLVSTKLSCRVQGLELTVIPLLSL